MRTHSTWLALVGLMCGPAIALAEEEDACEKASSHALVSCRLQAEADYWLEFAKCDELPNAGRRRACRRQAGQDRAAALEDCGAQSEAREEVCDDLGGAAYDPAINPADFVPVINNPYFPLTPGTTFVYESRGGTDVEHVEVIVTRQTRQILGVTCVQVRDTVAVGGDPVEDTLDWFTQDRFGNVWYFGENVKDFEDGLVVSIAGSWTAGVDGARPGIIMKAQPRVNDVYRQEYLLGEAEDLARVLSRTASVAVPVGSFTGCLQTEDFTPLAPEAIEHKYYAPGVGQVLTVNVETGVRTELIEIRRE